MALPFVDAENLRLARAGLTSHTARRWGFKTFFSIASQSDYLVNRYLETVRSPLYDDDGTLWEEVLGAIERLANLDIARHIVYFPPQTPRKRVYLYVPHLSAREGIYVKVEYGPSTNALENELRFLHEMSEARATFSVPRLLAHKFQTRYRGLLFHSFDHDFSPMMLAWEAHPFSLRNQIIGPIREVALSELGWWQHFLRPGEREHNQVRDLIAKHVTSPTPIGVGHGDFTSSNIFYKGQEVIVADWESASTEAPFMLDEVCYRLALRQRQVYRDPVAAYRKLFLEIVDKCHKSLIARRLDSVLLSIAYLVLNKNQEATRIADYLTDEIVAEQYGLSR